MDRPDPETDEERVARLLGALPAVPEATLQAAREIPRTQRELGDVLGRLAVDADFLAAARQGLDAALAAHGVTATPAQRAALARLLAR